MGIKIKKLDNKFVTMEVVAVVLLVLSVAIYKGIKTSGTSETQISSNPIDKTEEKDISEKILQYDFDEKTRILTSPELKGNEDNNFGRFKFQIKLPEGWGVADSGYLPDENAFSMRLANRNIYFVDFSYGDNPSAPLICGFPEEKEGEFHYEKINQYQEVNTNIGTIRVGKSTTAYTDSNIFRVCQYSKFGYTTQTRLGRINIIEPINQEFKIHQEIIRMLESIEIIKL